jgi:hypothetical protein
MHIPHCPARYDDAELCIAGCPGEHHDVPSPGAAAAERERREADGPVPWETADRVKVRPDPEDPQYTIDKLRGALTLAHRSRALWKSRAELTGWKPMQVLRDMPDNRDYGARCTGPNDPAHHFHGDGRKCVCEEDADNTQKSHYGVPDRCADGGRPCTNPACPCKQHKSDSVPSRERATMGRYHGWIHECGNVDWLPIGHAPADGGCDRCESGSNDASDWRPIYVGDR